MQPTGTRNPHFQPLALRGYRRRAPAPHRVPQLAGAKRWTDPLHCFWGTPCVSGKIFPRRACHRIGGRTAVSGRLPARGLPGSLERRERNSMKKRSSRAHGLSDSQNSAAPRNASKNRKPRSFSPAVKRAMCIPYPRRNHPFFLMIVSSRQRIDAFSSQKSGFLYLFSA